MAENSIPLNARLFNPKGIKKVMNHDIPNTCGVYIFLHKGKIVYVGKSIELRRRIASHYSKSGFTQLMINPDMEYQVAIMETKNEDEALILEDKLINEHKPIFNLCPFYKASPDDMVKDFAKGWGI